MQTARGPFKPIAGSTVSQAVTGTSANVPIPAVALGATACRMVFTAGTSGARVRSGVGTGIAAVSTDMLVPNPGTPFAYAESFGISGSDTHLGVKCDGAGTCTVEFTFGFGA